MWVLTLFSPQQHYQWKPSGWRETSDLFSMLTSCQRREWLWQRCHSPSEGRQRVDGHGRWTEKGQRWEKETQSNHVRKKGRTCMTVIGQNNVIGACFNFKRERKWKLKRTRNVQQVVWYCVWAKTMTDFICGVEERFALRLGDPGREEGLREWHGSRSQATSPAL